MPQAPSPSLRDALKAHRRRIPTLAPEWKRRLAREMLVRWIDHAECEETWRTIWARLKVEVIPDRFIAEIIQTRLGAAVLDASASDFTSKMHTITNRLSYEGKYQELADRNADFDREIVRFEDARWIAQQEGLLGRKTPGRMYFMRKLSAGFIRWCGRPLDNEVRVLTDIAFDCETTVEAVRAARSARARLDRGIRPRK